MKRVFWPQSNVRWKWTFAHRMRSVGASFLSRSASRWSITFAGFVHSHHLCVAHRKKKERLLLSTGIEPIGLNFHDPRNWDGRWEEATQAHHHWRRTKFNSISTCFESITLRQSDVLSGDIILTKNSKAVCIAHQIFMATGPNFGLIRDWSCFDPVDVTSAHWKFNRIH